MLIPGLNRWGILTMRTVCNLGTGSFAAAARVIPICVMVFLLGSISWASGPAAGRTEVISPTQRSDSGTTGFIENRGQLDETVHYYAPRSGVTTYFTDEAIVLHLREEVRHSDIDLGPDGHDLGAERPAREPHPSRGWVVRIWFEDANPTPSIEARGELPTRYNYFLGNDPGTWQADLPAYAEAVYRDLWPGIDLVYREDGGHISYELLLSAGADPQRVGFRYEGVDDVSVVENGEGSVVYRIETPLGAFLDTRPVPGCAKGSLSWTEMPLAEADDRGAMPNRDGLYWPNLEWSTYLGGSSGDTGYALALDPEGDVIVVGQTFSTNYPTTTGAYDVSYNSGGDVFVAKLDASGRILLWSTFLGGSAEDRGWAIAIDPSGHPIISGFTASSDFPTIVGSFDTTYNGGYDGFVTKLSSSGGGLFWSTFLGGSLGEIPKALTLDQEGHPVLVGMTNSTDFPTTAGSYDTVFNGGTWDGFATKLHASGAALIWSSFVGGTGSDYATTLVLDPDGNPVLAGNTYSSDFPTTAGAYSTSYSGGCDAFAAKLDASGSVLQWSTFLGGSAGEDLFGVALDPDRNPIVSGDTNSADFPTTAGAYDTSHNGGKDCLVAKLDASGSALIWSTFLGGNLEDRAHAIALAPNGNLVVAGHTLSPNFPTTPDAYDQSYNGGYDVTVMVLNSSAASLVWSSFLGGTNDERARALAVDEEGNATLTGRTASWDFPDTPPAYDGSHNGGFDAFVSRIAFAVQYAYIHAVPDANQPPTNTLGIPNITNFCAPMAAANITEYWDVVLGDPAAVGINAGLGARTAAEYIGHFMDTNDCGSFDRANGNEFPPSVGTYGADQEPGFFEYVRWDFEHMFDSPPPEVPGGKIGYTWEFRYVDITMASPDSGFSFCAAEIDAGRPVKIDFAFWNPQPIGVEMIEPGSGDTIVFCEWGPWLGGSTHPDHIETWNGLEGAEAIGHAVTGVGYVKSFDPDGAGFAWHADYMVVHDNWSDTPVNIAIPFQFAWTASVAADPPAGPQDVVFEPDSGIRTNRLLPATPSLLQGSTTVRYELAGVQDVRLSVHDVSGRLVRLLLDDRIISGQHAATWDGRDDVGRSVGCGVYFLRFRAGETRDCRSVLVVG